MHQIYFTTTNKGKVHSVSKALAPYGIEVIHQPIEVPEPRSDDLAAIAKVKVSYAYSVIEKPCIAQDAGFYIPSLNGFPKTFVNFALQTIGIEGILRLVDGKDRQCEFRNCLAYQEKTEQEPIYFESQVKGSLATEPRGELRDYAWSRLFLIFIPQGYDRTLAELTPEEYLAWRLHRNNDSFSTKFGEWYSNRP